LNIEWVNEITIGETIAIGISALIIISTIITCLLKLTSPNRAYDMALFDKSIENLISTNNDEVREYKVGQDHTTEIHARITVKSGTSIEKIRFRLVKRGFPYWRWIPERPRNAYICRIWDKYLENERSMNPYSLSRGTPLYTQKNETGILHLSNVRLLKGDIVWYRVIIMSNIDYWEGYLEYCGPSSDNRPAYSRRKIIVRSTTDIKDSQN
jgi:hypothetical protein